MISALGSRFDSYDSDVRVPGRDRVGALRVSDDQLPDQQQPLPSRTKPANEDAVRVEIGRTAADGDAGRNQRPLYTQRGTLSEGRAVRSDGDPSSAGNPAETAASVSRGTPAASRTLAIA